MSEQIKSLIDAVAANDTAAALSTFNDIVGEKVAIAIDSYKEQVASSFFSETVDEDFSIEDYSLKKLTKE